MRKLVFMFTCLCTLAHAQTDSLRSKMLNEVVVTATKTSKSLSETGKVLTVIDEKQLRQSGGKDLSQLLNEQTGIVVNGANSSPGKDKSLYLRGAANKYTLILLDGIPLNDPSGIDGGAYDLRLIPVQQIERIEVLKGSQSTLYGSDALAGAINIITKQGGLKPISGQGSLSYGSYNTWRGNAAISGSAKAIDYNISYSHFDTDGISEANDATGQGNFDKDGATQNAVQVNLGIKASSSLSFKPFLRYNNFFSNFDAGAYQDSKISNGRYGLFSSGISMVQKLKRGSVSLLYGYTSTERNYVTDYGKSTYNGKFHNADLYWSQNLSEKIQLLAGTNFQYWKVPGLNGTEKDPSISITSPYASLFFKNIVKGFNLELGGRENIHSKYGNNFTWSVNPSYWVHQQMKVFFNYSTGFKAPMLGQLFGPYGANPNLKPERGQSIDAGIQFVSADQKFDVRTVFFTRNIKDVIIYNSQYTYSNFDEQNDYGVEVEPSFQVDKLTIKAFYNFVDGKVKTNVAGKDTTYNNLIRRPKNSFGASIGYQATPKLFFSVSVKTFGQRNDQYSDATFALQKVTLAGYQLLDVYLDYKANSRFRFFVDGRNLLNQDYMEVAGYNALKANVNAGFVVNF